MEFDGWMVVEWKLGWWDAQDLKSTDNIILLPCGTRYSLHAGIPPIKRRLINHPIVVLDQ